MTTDAPGRPTARRVDGSMSLLVDMMTNSLDEAYAEAARARGTGPEATGPVRRRRSRSARLGPLVGLLAVGLLTGTAVGEVRDRSAESSGLRSGLADEVVARTGQGDALAAEAAALRDEVAGLQEQALGTDAAGRAAARDLELLGAASATTAVRGPGLVVRLDDAPQDATAADPLRDGTVPEGRVSDQDLQDVVNGLWAAGAEAVAVNRQRLTTLSAIRSAGESVLVDLRPLSPPYTVEAVGDPAGLEVGFVAGPSGSRLTTLTSLYGIVVDVRRSDELVLRGSGDPVLRNAVPVPRPGPVPSGPS